MPYSGKWMPTRTGTRSGTRSSPDDRAKFADLATQRPRWSNRRVSRLPGRERGDPRGAAAAIVAGGGESAVGDLGLLMTLGGTYPIDREDGANERLRWYQAAVAAAPANLAAPTTWASRCKDKGQLDEAIACYQKAIELDPKFAKAHTTWALR